jgi:sirohydrochlorin ferrochelatase
MKLPGLLVEQPVLIVAHGQPSDPRPLAVEVAALAARVAALLPGRHVGAATLAEPGALAAALSAASRAASGPGLVYPMFMAGGWFTRTHLPRKLAEAGGADWRVLEPMGCDPAIHQLALTIAKESGAEEVLLAAHGSGRSTAPADIARHVAGVISMRLGLHSEAVFIDQPPRLSEATGLGPNAVCLPFFATGGGHVTGDIPAQLEQAWFRGRILPPLGQDERVPALIAKAITAGQPICAAACRWARDES